LLLAGGGPEEARLKGLATELGVDKAIIFTGRIAHSDITRYYSLVDLLVLPRRAMRLTHLVTPLKPWKRWRSDALWWPRCWWPSRADFDGSTGCISGR
jgi:hypothetical protein